MKLLLLAALFAASSLHAGGSEGHGADTERANAWYTGNEQPVYYCSEFSPAFLTMRSESEWNTLIEGTWVKWVNYMATKQVEGPLLPKWARFRKTLKKGENGCKGVDLKFSFGVCKTRTMPRYDTRRLVARALPPIPNTPGLIWFADPGTGVFRFGKADHAIDWSQPGILENALLHEVGHIFGNDHVRGTVMDEDLIPQLMRQHLTNASPRPAEIDGTRELYVCDDCLLENLAGELGWQRSELPAIWKQLTGRDVGKDPQVTLTLERRLLARLVLKDSSGAPPTILPIELPLASASVHTGEDVFRTEIWPGYPISRPHTASVRPGVMTVGTKRLRVALERNMQASEFGRLSHKVMLYEVPSNPMVPKKLLFHSGPAGGYALSDRPPTTP